MPVLRVALSMALSIGLTVALQLLIRARLSPERRARMWNGATWGASVYAFGPASMLGFFWHLRGPGIGGVASALGLGLASTAALLGAVVGVDWLFGLAIGDPG